MKINNDCQRKINLIIKQMSMLEDKLFNPRKRDLYVIQEHFLIVEGLINAILEECTYKVFPIFGEINLKLVEYQKSVKKYIKNEEKLNVITQNIRSLRKELTKKCFKPITYKKTSVERTINKKLKQGILPILNPLFNLREAHKNILLILDHLTSKEHRCNQCHKKHSLLIEAFLEEGLTLDKESKYKKVTMKLLKEIVKAQKEIMKEHEGYSNAIKIIKKMKKTLEPLSLEFLDYVNM